jgi:4-hydroxy-2-oxoglutarate aldolase
LLSENLRKVLLPITTPFRSEVVDHDALRANVDRWTTTGVGGYVILGSTGERVHLDEHEYHETIETCRAIVPRSMAFIVGAGQQSTLGTIKEIAKATDAGADAVLVITPNYYRSAITQDALISYYKAVADAARVPVLLYSMPALTGIKIQPETIAQLSEHPNIIGAKDSSNDVAGFKRTVERCPDEFAVMSGNGTVFLDALEAGATGGILAVGCVVPEVCVEILRLFNAGELEHARTLQNKLRPLAEAVTTRFGIGGLKAALEMAGYRGGEVRAPLRAPDESALREIEALLHDCRAHNDVP